jgi:hypothetical protein
MYDVRYKPEYLRVLLFSYKFICWFITIVSKFYHFLRASYSHDVTVWVLGKNVDKSASKETIMDYLNILFLRGV